MRDEKIKNKFEDGLPEISQERSRGNPIILVVCVVALVLIFGGLFYKNRDNKPQKTIEESYTIQPDSQMDSHKDKIIIDKRQAAASSQANPEFFKQQLAFIQEKQNELRKRLSAPLMLVNVNSSAKGSSEAQQTPMLIKDENAMFTRLGSTPNSETVSTLGKLDNIVAQGSLIHAVLEFATNSDLPGFLRAIVNEPVYSEDGVQILIPRGSRLLGQYKNGILQGQSRIFIVWTRLITPAGISINLVSPGVDNLGVAGMGSDGIDRHFWERFSTASLLSLIGTGTSLIGVKDKNKENLLSTYGESVANSFAQSASQSLKQNSVIGPTLRTYQGKEIIVFVARDLNFQSAIKMIKPKINVL